MNYYDGNTVTALWNYAQQFAMSDNSYGTTFGPSAPGAINLVSGDTGNVDMSHTANNPSIASATSTNADLTPDGKGGYSLTSDAQPYWDDCSTRDAVALNGTNIGDELNAAGVSWGWFQGGFRPTTSYTDALTAVGKSGQPTSTFIPDQFAKAGFNTSVPHSTNQGICNAVTPVGAGLSAPLTPGTGQYGYKDDYIPHHEPFQYYAVDGEPAPPDGPDHRQRPGHARRAARDRPRHPVLRQGRAAVQHAEPPVRHERLRTSSSRRSARASCPRRRCPRSASSRPPATRTGTPRTPTRWTSSGSSSTRSTPCRRPRTGSPPR